MQPYQQRVIDEKKELDTKLSKLSLFRTDGKFRELVSKDQELLNLQYHIMEALSMVLTARIKNFKE